MAYLKLFHAANVENFMHTSSTQTQTQRNIKIDILFVHIRADTENSPF